MTDGLRKGLTSYGDAGFSLFLRKAFIKAGGYSDDALDRFRFIIVTAKKMITQGNLLKKIPVARIQLQSVFQILNRFLPPALPAINK